MSILTMPAAPGFQESSFGIITNTDAFISPLSGTVQTKELPGSRWQAKYVLPRLRRDQFAVWQAFFLRLRGASGRFYGYDPLGMTPQGVATGSPVIDGGGQTGTTLNTKGWVAGQVNILRAGDYLAFDTTYGRQLVMVTEDVNSDGSGNSSLSIEPPIRHSPDDEAVIILENASCEMMLVDGSVSWNMVPPAFYRLTFNAVEAFGTNT